MSSDIAHRLSAYVIALGVLFTLVAVFIADAHSAWSTGVGAAVAVANWYLLKWIVTRVIDGGTTSKGGFIALLFLKMGGLMGGVYALLATHTVSPLPFTLGMSALVGGLLIGSLLYVIGASPVESEH